MKRRRKSFVVPPRGARVSSEIVDAGPPLTGEQIKEYYEKHGLPAPDRLLVPTPAEVAKLPAAARAAFAARCAARVAPLGHATDPHAVAALLVAAARVGSPVFRWLRCVRRDFDRLVFLAKKHNWTDDTPVPPDVFGPLWPKDLAPAWAAEPAGGASG
jgi:hypothetical protein